MPAIGPDAECALAPPGNWRRRCSATLSIVALSLATASAHALELPTGDVLLVIDGAIEQTNVGDEAHFDRSMLELLERDAFATPTPWSDGVQQFEGALLSALLEAVGARSGVFEASATDDYTIEFDQDDLADAPPIVAYLHNGEPMSLRQLGPLRIVFPYDRIPSSHARLTHALSVWQLTRMTIR